MASGLAEQPDWRTTGSGRQEYRTRMMARSNLIDLNPEILAAAAESKAWPF